MRTVAPRIITVAVSVFLATACSSVTLGKKYSTVAVHYLDSTNPERKAVLEKQIADALTRNAGFHAVPEPEIATVHVDATVDVGAPDAEGAYRVEVVEAGGQRAVRVVYVRPDRTYLKPESGVLADMIASELSKEGASPALNDSSLIEDDLPSRL